MLSRSFLLLLLLVRGAAAQFKCTMTASDEDSCLATVDDDDQHCAWCSLGGFSFCLSEQAAEAMEQTLHADCERYHGRDDDAVPEADDIFPSNDDDHKPKSDDDGVSPNDDAVPDNFWTCLQMKDPKSCDSKGCTWCTAPTAGFSLCMSGPAAEQAQESKFFQCERGSDSLEEEPAAGDAAVAVAVEDPYDTTCVEAFLQEQTEEACTSTVDQEGASCKWCSLAGMTNLCLNSDQAEMGQALGITCENDVAVGEEPIVAAAAPLYDMDCLVTMLQDGSPASCSQAVDSDGSPCEFCSIMNGALELCLTSDQVSLVEQSGMPCQHEKLQENPYDASCVTATLSGADKEGCVATVDEDGQSCRYCSVAGLASLCLTNAQADLAGNYGLACDEQDSQKVQDSPYDVSCLLAYLQDQSPEGCAATVDEDGESCQFCTLQGAMSLCLTSTQADIASGMGVECGKRDESTLNTHDFFDTSCVKAYLSDPSGEACRGTMDEDGAACKWCHTPQSGDLCLTAAQGDIAGQLGMWCDDDDAVDKSAAQIEEGNVGLPDDFWTCLQNFDEAGCRDSCTWCGTSAGMGFCLSTPVAEATKACTFFDCNFKDGEMTEQEDTTLEASDPFDPTCLGAGMGSDDAESICNTTTDGSGQSCVWCNAAGVFGVCVSAEQAAMMGDYLRCNAASPLMAVA